MRSERLEQESRNLLYVLIFFAFLGPVFLVVQAGFFHLYPFRIIWLLMLPLSAVYLYHNRQTAFSKLVHCRGLFVYLAAWFVYALLSLFWVVEITPALRQVVFLFIGISLIFITVIFLDRPGYYQKLHRIWLAAMLLIMAIGFWNLLSGQHLANSRHHGETVHIPTAVFHNPNDLATYLALSLPFVFCTILYCRATKTRTLLTIFLVCAVVLFFAAGSQVNIIALACGALFWLVLLADRKQQKRGTLILLVGLLLMFLLFNFFSDILPGPFQRTMDRALGLYTFITGNLFGDEPVVSMSYTSRINFVRNALIYLCGSWGFGVGAGNAEHYTANYPYHYTFGYDNLHNFWLELAVNYGVLIFAGFVWYYLSLMVNLFRFRKLLSPGAERAVAEALLLSLVIFFFAVMSPSSSFGFGFLWVLLAMATGFVNACRLREKAAAGDDGGVHQVAADMVNS